MITYTGVYYNINDQTQGGSHVPFGYGISKPKGPAELSKSYHSDIMRFSVTFLQKVVVLL